MAGLDISATVAITEGNWPNIHAAVSNVAYDSGMVNQARSLESWLAVPLRWEPYLVRVEAALATLSKTQPAPEDSDVVWNLKPESEGGNGAAFTVLDSEFYSFCCGETRPMEAIRERTIDGTLAGNFLDDFFEGWSLYEDREFLPDVKRS